MSGPKVVRIVTREEILDICNGMLARVDAALAEWRRIGERNECIDDDAVAAAVGRRNGLAALIARDRFMDLQKQAPIEEGFLRNDIQSRLAKVAAEQAAARTRGRREREAASSLLRTLRTGGDVVDADLLERLERGEPDAIAQGFGILSGRATAPTASRDLAGRLREDRAPASFAAWLAARPAASDPAIDRIELRLAELAPLADDRTLAGWRSRLDEAADAQEMRRGLLLDGLEVATGRALTDARARAAALTECQLVLSELDTTGIDTTALRTGIDALDATAIADRITEAGAALRAERDARAAATRRAAVLEGLSGLGYEVNEGMRTTFAAEGRLVLRSATRSDYGVEINAAGERMQMRPVAFEAGGYGPSASRDRDAETIWCGDVSALQAKLGDDGGGLVIERSLPIGATPLKRIRVEEDRNAAAEYIPRPQERTLR